MTHRTFSELAYTVGYEKADLHVNPQDPDYFTISITHTKNKEILKIALYFIWIDNNGWWIKAEVPETFHVVWTIECNFGGRVWEITSPKYQDLNISFTTSTDPADSDDEVEDDEVEL